MQQHESEISASRFASKSLYTYKYSWYIYIAYQASSRRSAEWLAASAAEAWGSGRALGPPAAAAAAPGAPSLSAPSPTS